MTVLLVLVTFFTFILIDYLLSRKKAPKPLWVAATRQSAGAEDMFVEGFLVPDRVRYHPGHSWALRERKNLVRVGIDEFAAALMGRIERVETPKPGLWVRQGQNAITFYRDGEKTMMVSPTEGEIVEVNPEVLKDPSLLRKDPYGAGWLMVVYSPDEETMHRNLVPRNMVTAWMREAAERLYARQPQLAGAVAADGGSPAQDLFAALPDASWRELTEEFFLPR